MYTHTTSCLKTAQHLFLDCFYDECKFLNYLLPSAFSSIYTTSFTGNLDLPVFHKIIRRWRSNLIKHCIKQQPLSFTKTQINPIFFIMIISQNPHKQFNRYPESGSSLNIFINNKLETLIHKIDQMLGNLNHNS